MAFAADLPGVARAEPHYLTAGCTGAGLRTILGSACGCWQHLRDQHPAETGSPSAGAAHRIYLPTKADPVQGRTLNARQAPVAIAGSSRRDPLRRHLSPRLGDGTDHRRGCAVRRHRRCSDTTRRCWRLAGSVSTLLLEHYPHRFPATARLSPSPHARCQTGIVSRQTDPRARPAAIRVELCRRLQRRHGLTTCSINTAAVARPGPTTWNCAPGRRVVGRAAPCTASQRTTPIPHAGRTGHYPLPPGRHPGGGIQAEASR